ncbi:MAG TPA: D-TA family PLP-dependent enzyme [Pirellulaceae bacterium]|jgi:D-serine deaminase-like pyridoxal phosphate-dependent protein|nr:D-TA family PLP-dependent enzyme [Pirellulaceae bacterium]
MRFDQIASHIFDEVLSPALVVDYETVVANVEKTIQIARRPERLRPHCKTHKTLEVTRLYVERGVTAHKAATIAECEALADAGAGDVLLAYPLVGPNAGRMLDLMERHPGVRFSALIDSAENLAHLKRVAKRRGTRFNLFLDVETGLGRTGAPLDERGAELYIAATESESVTAIGLHVYDGHRREADVTERTGEVSKLWDRVRAFRDGLVGAGHSVEEIVVGGTGSFPVWATFDDPALRLSPGTTAFWDEGYRRTFPDLPFVPAAAIYTRAISRPSPTRLTFDAGSKSVASDPPMEKRLFFPAFPDATIAMQNEEHLVLERPDGFDLAIGQGIFGIPWHVCPSSALHRELVVVKEGRIDAAWKVVARDRRLTV